MTPMTRKEAKMKAQAIVNTVRGRGWRDGAPSFSDAQIWQAILDAKSADPDMVAVHLVEQVIEGRIPPACTYWEEAS